MRVYKFIYGSKWFKGPSLQVRLRVCCCTFKKKKTFSKPNFNCSMFYPRSAPFILIAVCDETFTAIFLLLNIILPHKQPQTTDDTQTPASVSHLWLLTCPRTSRCCSFLYLAFSFLSISDDTRAVFSQISEMSLHPV